MRYSAVIYRREISSIWVLLGGNERKGHILVIHINIVFDFREDWLLRFLYRSTRMSVSGVAGLQKVELESRKMQNEDLTNIIKGCGFMFNDARRKVTLCMLPIVNIDEKFCFVFLGHTDYPEKMYEILTYIGDIPLAFRGS